MLSPSVSVPTPEGASLHPTSSRRRALSYLRHLSHSSQTRSGSGSPTDAESPRTSPRSYFHRSTSYPEPRNQSAPSRSRRRSTSRSNERDETDHLLDGAVSRLNTNTSELRVPSPTGGETTNTDNEAAPDPQEQSPERTSDDMVRTTRGSSGAAASLMDSATRPSRPARTVTGGSTVSNTDATGASGTESKAMALPAIRFFPHQEVRSNGRQSLNFGPVSRTLPSDDSIIRVGRYSEREGVPNANPIGPSDAPVGFKSKVVSRKHCEFSFMNGEWYIKDVASSSGTFLNHIRLSPPNTESKPFPVKDGDIVQLGIDFRGGEEMIFRCVKIRVECNRSWQKKPNTFNKQRHAQLQMLAKDQPAADASSGECCICLGRIAPCQFLFVAPCAHTWHYKCIRPLLEGRSHTYPQFQCPNCRAYWDLNADVDVDVDMGDDDSAAEADDQPTVGEGQPLAPSIGSVVATIAAANEGPAADGLTRNSTLLSRRQANKPASPEIASVSNAIDVPGRSGSNGANLEPTRTQTPDGERIINGEGPLTPRNDAGPFILDGSAGRASGHRVVAIDEVTESDS